MALFQVEGWNLKQDKVAIGGGSDKKKEKKERKKAKKIEHAIVRKEEEKQLQAGHEEHAKTQAEETESKSGNTNESGVKKENPKKRKHEEKEVQAVVPDKPLPITLKLTPLQQKMMAKLSGSRFRWINEQLYTITSKDALKLIEEQPELFDEYHQGFRSQVQSWPENPVDVFVDQIKTRASAKPVNAPGGLPGLPNKKVVIADMGCGEAQLALDVNNFTKQYNSKKPNKKQKQNQGRRFQTGPKTLDIEVHSFDLKKANDRITVADIKNIPLPDGSCTVVIFCLALMGTNFLDFIKEAYRLLAPRGELWIAEIKSRFTESSEAKSIKPEDIGSEFVDSLKLCGFFHKKTDNDNKMFTRFEFFKPPQDIINERKAKLERRKKFVEHEDEKEQFELKRSEKAEGEWLLKPCIYKRR
ncbi:uncharacterized protein AC631_01845 [Debaryomyces fabryi]|uniref:Ribosomal RNA-processing protein 8 n=1 Tax=Debaryomyces fabryi TaxID=58627 RepID=A0A0V1Q1M1_9ASCO|nr:uncharacterized protein AC631_01845 [Debaryomyces fabryi]KSA02381.1 hypothetical protein AC631_01845 [Debaryomyces fabryi]CUM56540.1 unnamed protein product [Debaryomyces fabryi]